MAINKYSLKAAKTSGTAGTGGLVGFLQRTRSQAPTASRLSAPAPSGVTAVPPTMSRDAGVLPPSNSTRTAARPAARPAATGGSGGGYTGGALAANSAGSYGGAPMAAPMPSIDDPNWEPTDSAYMAEAAGINSDTQTLLDELKRQRGLYELDWKTALRNLGYDQGAGQWDRNNRLGAYYQATNNQQNDFASRGLMNSSLYANALADLEGSFGQQLGDLNAANLQDETGYKERVAAATTQKDNALKQARMNALARLTSGLSLG